MGTRFETLAADTARRAADLAAWTSQLVEGATEHGQDLVLNLPAAVEAVFGIHDPRDEALKGLDSWKLDRLATDYFRAEAELLERTEGQPFRLERLRGPLFIESELWRFSGGGVDAYNSESVSWEPLEAAA